MEEISIVRRRARIWPAVLLLILFAVIVLAALWVMGYFGPTEINVLMAPSSSLFTGSA
jgi:ABC-type transporter Mla subunit MlaD